MPPTSLLPASAAAFAPRASPTVVLSRVEQWMTVTLKRVNKVKRPLNNVGQHTRCLTEILSHQNAIWNLCSIMLPKAPESKLPKDDNPLVDALFNYQLAHMEAYVVHVDMVSQNEIAFKLTPETIETLIDHHKEIYSVDTASKTWDWPEKEIQLKKLQEEFVQAVNRFVYRTSASALEGMEEEGAGELLCGLADEAKAAIMGLFVPLLPPPPRIVDVVRSTPLVPSSTGPDDWWHHSPTQQSPSPVDSWDVLPSSPSTTTSDSHPNMWPNIGYNDMSLSSPPSSHCQPFSTAAFTTSEFYECPTTLASAVPYLLPDMLVQHQCGTAAGMDGFVWADRYPEFALQYGTAM
ncbi:hypothetical protein A7C99_5832 [Trichophyton rubrum]|uniref:Uncharacterized protein n=3 Tax=Trichophyton rubrum TaxID=5551 RepID=A0A178ETX3_TRIRU|nr:uncharacterized protein TERG_00471 [Trichophyton rubrum CBS 118892]EZF10974.1 hypothetical protein H100_07905 [Trichophyton rubrum MR850]EZF37841.1 hypothetical protein H102_07865 [Trichophyton rubrum CBS 100081]EZF80364.1 hypothetical protein H110_07889 [Trichophyton rubrum MR1448]EZG12675.1 hypothetical protein H107_08029 [Trichophyton rubrum CBS 202.88]OAL63438.1 hypothetical protein A7C99_5832 [Trichophyton rubrum]